MAQSSNSDWAAVILAAGRGTRMNSPLPKVLHPVAGKPMIQRAIQCCQAAGVGEVRVVVGYGEKLVRQIVEPMGVYCYKQVDQRGTADAVRSAQIETLEGVVMILNGDHPLLEAADLKSLFDEFMASGLDVAVVSCDLKVPGHFGRIVRHLGQLKAIVETKDASHETLKIREVNTGVYFSRADALRDLLPRIKNNNSKNEFYLTDLIALGLEMDYKVGTLQGTPRVAFGVNSQSELAKATRIVHRRKNQALMDAGVVLLDPRTTYVEEQVSVGSASVIYPGVVLRGQTTLGAFNVVEPNCYLSDVRTEDSVQIKAMSHLEDCSIKTKSVIGPFARLRPGTEIGVDCRVGNFVETKKLKMGDGSKAAHLAYLGDATLGRNVNVGCGTITCNYAVDRNKYQTLIGDDVFVGSDSQFVAPVKIGDRAVIGSGSTITKDVPADALAVSRAEQVVREGYAKRFKRSETEAE
jgi:bifunctional UDP-N-acetylglucosamine pyrophosphorylase/glucosamine-1-phosphate N-acetyltransferase